LDGHRSSQKDHMQHEEIDPVRRNLSYILYTASQ
jgi:hypothetical protein